MSTSIELHRPSSKTSLQRPSLLSKGSRSLSANNLKDKLSKLAVTPLHVPNPVAALQSNVECVMMLYFFFCGHVVITWLFVRLSSFVPAKIPRARRIQTLVVALWSTAIAIMTSLWLALWYVFFFSFRLFSLTNRLWFRSALVPFFPQDLLSCLLGRSHY